MHFEHYEAVPDHLRLLLIVVLQTFRHLLEPVGSTGMLTGCE